MNDKVIKSFQGKYAFLSNFYPCPMMVAGIEYPTLEHAYQAEKTNNLQEKLKISKLKTPGEAKRYGGRIKLRPSWNKEKLRVMAKLLKLKFQDPMLQKFLVDTRGFELVEGNNWGDRFWGRVGKEGENWLGLLLENVRAEILDKLCTAGVKE